MSTTINTTELVKAHVAEFECERTWKNLALQEALLSSAEYTINVVGVVHRQYPNHNFKVEIDHIAIFKSKDVAAVFASLADDFGYWVMSIRDAIESEITVRFTHQVNGVTVKNLASLCSLLVQPLGHVLTFCLVIHDSFALPDLMS